MKGVYITTDGNSESAGVEKKIANQIKVFSQYHDITRVRVLKKPGVINKIIARFPGGSNDRMYSDALRIIRDIDPGFFYFRGIEFDKKYVVFIETLRKEFPKAKILFEVPTYPYGKELILNKTMWPWFFKDAFLRKRVSKNFDKIVTFSTDDEIFGVATIKIKNGIIVDDIVLEDDNDNNDESNLDDTAIKLLAVAQFQKYHGYERVLNGIADYYRNGGDRIIKLDMVGDGNEKEKYLKMAQDLSLEKNVSFHGRVVGKDLDNFYRRADIGLGSFALYKLGINRVSSLKIREYLAYGLPVISGCNDDVFEDVSADFYKGFSNDNSNVDFFEIVSFYDSLRNKYSRNELKSVVREFAKNHVDMSVTMKEILDYLKE